MNFEPNFINRPETWNVLSDCTQTLPLPLIPEKTTRLVPTGCSFRNRPIFLEVPVNWTAEQVAFVVTEYRNIAEAGNRARRKQRTAEGDDE
jgi:hypothetical protein